jgi:hypothetical protein
MSFQFIIDNAAEIIVNNQPLVASTTTRDGTVRSVSRGGQPWVFTVTLPDGPRWTDYREAISTAQRYDRHTAQTIQFNNSGHDWLFEYQGDLTPPNPNGSFNGDWSTGFDTFTMTGGTGSGNRVVAGDFVQLGANGHVYQVVETSSVIDTSIRVHRPIIENSGSGDVFVGSDCTFTVKATQFPQPRIFAYNQVGWTGAFVFVEEIS